MRFLKALILVFTLAMVFTASFVSAQTDAVKASEASAKALSVITKADIEELIRLTDKASVEKNIDLLGTFLADDAKIIYKNMPTPQGPQRMETNKADYLSITKLGMLSVEKYEVTRKDLEIQIDEGGKKATIRDIVTEKITGQGKTTETSTKETLTCELRDGKIFYVLLEGEISGPK